jgi:hypothetical protein
MTKGRGQRAKGQGPRKNPKSQGSRAKDKGQRKNSQAPKIINQQSLVTTTSNHKNDSYSLKDFRELVQCSMLYLPGYAH